VTDRPEIFYLNLTNGLEYVDRFPGAHYVRIQSTHVERKRYDLILEHLDADLLFRLAVGHSCVIVDGSPGHRASKTCRLAVPIIRYVLMRLWYTDSIGVSGVDPAYLDGVYCKLMRANNYSLKSKLKYYRRYTKCGDVRIRGLCFPTANDGKYDFFAEIARGL